jgi:hypothetical protein
MPFSGTHNAHTELRAMHGRAPSRSALLHADDPLAVAARPAYASCSRKISLEAEKIASLARISTTTGPTTSIVRTREEITTDHLGLT